MKNLKFVQNWNNKLDCNIYTTIRLRNDKKYKVGEHLNVTLQDKQHHVATVLDINHFKLAQMSPGMAMIDTGYLPNEAKRLFRRFYPKVNFEKKEFSMIFLMKNK